MPIVADIHSHYKRAIESAEAGAACLRINPGNIGSGERVRAVVQAAKDHGCSMRIGVNAGSLEKDLLEKYGEPCPEAMVESALNHARILEDRDFFEFKISCKASDVFLAGYRSSLVSRRGLGQGAERDRRRGRILRGIGRPLGVARGGRARLLTAPPTGTGSADFSSSSAT